MRLGYSDAAKYLGLCEPTLRSMVSRKQVPHYRLAPRLVVFDQADLDQWLVTHRVEIKIKIDADGAA